METSISLVQTAAENAAFIYGEWYKSDEASLGECQTRYAFIDPILRALGWDTTDPKICYPEWKYRKHHNKRVDYALFSNNTSQEVEQGAAVPAIIIEAKSVYQTKRSRREYGQAIWEEDIQQLQDYIHAEPRMKEGLAVFTNGRRWLLFLLGDGRGLRDIAPVQADLELDGAELFAETLYKYMARPNW